MKFKELFRSTQQPISNMGTTKFRLTLDKEAILTPHYSMSKVYNMLESRPSIRNGLKQHVRFLLKDISFESEDEKSQEFANQWLEQRFHLKKEVTKFTELLLSMGTSYLEPQFVKTAKNGLKINTYYCFPDPSIVYKNLAAKGDDDYWLIEVPMEVRNYGDATPQFFPVYYMKGTYIFRRMVYAIPRHKESLVQATIGLSRTNDYGWGLLNSAVNNDDILEEITKNWALIAKFRSLGKKIIGFYNDNGESVDPNELDVIKQQFANLEEEDSLLVNKKFVSEDLTFTGDDNLMNQEVMELKKEIGASLTPNYMTPWSQDSSYATAQESKVPFSMELEAEQEELRDVLNNIITKTLREENSWLADDLTIAFPNPELYSRESLFNMMSQLYNTKACTFNELRVSAGLPAVEGGDTWGQEPPLDNITVSVKKENKAFKESIRNKYKEAIMFENIKFERPSVRMETSEEALLNKKEKFKEAVKGFLK